MLISCLGRKPLYRICLLLSSPSPSWPNFLSAQPDPRNGEVAADLTTQGPQGLIVLMGFMRCLPFQDLISIESSLTPSRLRTLSGPPPKQSSSAQRIRGEHSCLA